MARDSGFLIRPGVPALVLAPMEGVTDAPMRAVLTASGAFTQCVSEFIRVSFAPPPAHVFLRHIPELGHGAKTVHGTPVQVQLLGGEGEKLARAAVTAVRLGSPGVDLNFGCPAKRVNGHDGGAVLLKAPVRIRGIVEAVRRAVPPGYPVSAKLRLGWESIHDIRDTAAAAWDGGADWVTIHARTKVQGYAPPVYWEPIGEIRARLPIPVVANGDIWTLEDWRRCREITGAEHFMLGRGVVADPGLAPRIYQEMWGQAPTGTPRYCPRGPDARQWLPALRALVEYTPEGAAPTRYLTNRIKQWGGMASRRGTASWFDRIKRIEDTAELFRVLEETAVYPSNP